MDRMRVVVKIVFILCYVAFMWASIHHVATFFNDFEQNNGNMFGSYLLAGAFDITALVTTIAVMFFRKSMPTPVFVGVWIFIIAITGYSAFVNWEYASHYQNMSLIMQATGRMIPTYDQQGILHYVPEMEANTVLLWINPIMASAFTAFSLIYSIVAEFFGSKPPTADELQERLTYLQSVETVQSQIKAIENKNKTSIIKRAANVAKEAKEAVEEVLAKEEVIQPVTTPEISQSVEAKAEVNPLSDGSDRFEQTVTFLQQYPDATDEELAAELGMNRTAAARFWRLKAEEIATLNYAQKVEVKTERITAPLGTQGGSQNGNDMVVGEEPDAELFEEIPEEEYQQFCEDEGGSEDEPITDPDVEVIHAKNNQGSGSSTVSKTSTVNIATRRKPMTVAEVARELVISERQVRGLRAQGKLAKDDQDETLIKAASVRAYKAGKKVKVS